MEEQANSATEVERLKLRREFDEIERQKRESVYEEVRVCGDG